MLPSARSQRFVAHVNLSLVIAGGVPLHDEEGITVVLDPQVRPSGGTSNMLELIGRSHRHCVAGRLRLHVQSCSEHVGLSCSVRGVRIPSAPCTVPFGLKISELFQLHCA
jgi:hypothetical protein